MIFYLKFFFYMKRYMKPKGHGSTFHSPMMIHEFNGLQKMVSFYFDSKVNFFFKLPKFT
jgi:hypothetical protein